MAAYWSRFSILLMISVIIATVGLYRNSGAVVIAAMLIAPLMTPILGIAAALVMGLTARVLRLLLFVILAAGATSLAAYVLMVVVDAPRGLVIPQEVMARTDPGLEELMVALAAGIAGAYVQLRKEEASMLPGVAIGVSLVPPLAAAGILAYFAEFELAWEATLLFLTNLAAIVLCACLVFLALGLRPAMRDKQMTTRVTLGAVVSFIVVAVLAVDLANVTLERFREARDEELVLASIQEWAGPHSVETYRVDVDQDQVELWMVFDVPWHRVDQVAAPGQLVSSDLDENRLVKGIQEVLGRDVEVLFRGNIRFAGRLGSGS